MKVTQYITDSTLQCEAYSLKPALKMVGANTITVLDSQESSFLGFGVALTGSSCYNLSLMSPDERSAFLKDIFSKEGLGLSVVRLTVASSDYSAELYSYDDVENDTQLKSFSIERDKEYIFPIIKEILKINPRIYFYASPWSPPGWMKTGGSMCGGFMREEFLDCYADYLVRYVKEYEKCGIKISALTIQNEPYTDQGGCMPACIWHPEMQAKFVPILKGRLNKNGLNTEIWFHDHNFKQISQIKWCLDNKEKLAENCNGIAFHYYSGKIEQTRAIKKLYSNIPLHFTEGGPRLYDNYDTDWCKWAIMAIKALSEGFSSFTGWNLLLDERGGPNIGPFFCGGLATLKNDRSQLAYSGQYKAFRQISPFIKKGAVIYSATVDGNEENMASFPKMKTPRYACIVENTDGSRVLISANANTEKSQMQYFYDGKWWYFEMMPNSISTVVFENKSDLG